MTHRVPIPGPLNLSLTVSSVTALSSRCYCPPGCSCPREVHEAAFPTPGVPCGRPGSSHRARSLCQTHPLRYRLIKDPEARLSFCIWKSRTRALWGSKNTSGMESLATQMGQIRGNKILSCETLLMLIWLRRLSVALTHSPFLAELLAGTLTTAWVREGHRSLEFPSIPFPPSF